MSYDWTPERYRRRQPSCWDPPWTRRTTAYQQSSSYELDMYSPSPPRRRPTCWDPPIYRETPRRTSPTGWPTQRRLHAYEQQQRRYAYGQQQQQRNPNVEIIMLQDYQPPCPPYTDPDSYGQPQNFDDGYQPLPLPEYQRPQPLPEYQPPRPLPVSDRALHPPQQPKKFIQSSQQRGLPKNPAFEVQSLSPVQQAAINDYNEKLRIYRLERAALLARLNVSFEENIHDENQVEEKTDDNPMIVLGGDTPNDITNVPNDGASLDVPNNESVEEIVKKEGIVKNENESLPVRVEAYDDKIGDLIAPIHQELEIKDDAKKGFYVENLMEKCVSCHEDFTRMLFKSQSKRMIDASDNHSKSSRSHNLFTAKIESWFSFQIQSLIYDQHQPCVFDPGGELSTLFVLKFPP